MTKNHYMKKAVRSYAKENGLTYAQAFSYLTKTGEIHKNSNPHPKQTSGRIISITTARGGSGVTTSAITLANIAKTLTKPNGDPYKIALVDLDYYNGQIAYFNNLPEEYHPINDMPLDEITDSVVTKTFVPINNFNIILLNHKVKADAVYFKHEKILNILKTMYDLIIIDTGVSQFYADAHLAHNIADEIYYILRHSSISNTYTETYNKWIENSRNDTIRKTKVIVNSREHLNEHNVATIQKQLNSEILSQIRFINLKPDTKTINPDVQTVFSFKRLLEESLETKA